MTSWGLRAQPPRLLRPVPIDPDGRAGPTKGAAAGPGWRRTSRGMYVPSSVDRALVEQRLLEEACRLPANGAITGWGALRLHGAGYFDGLDVDGKTLLDIPLAVPPGTNLAPQKGTVIHRERLDQDERTTAHGIAVTVPARAAFDAARRAVDLRAAVIALDMAIASGVLHDAREVATFLDAKQRWPGVKQVRRALELIDARSMSPKETLLRLIWVLDARLPVPRSNWPVADGTGRLIGRPDLLSEELGVVGEFDGAEHRSRSRHRDDLRRDDRFREVGLEPFRVVGADLYDKRLVLTRIRSAVERAKVSTVPRTWLLQARPRRVR
jgi:hypothetical protein